MSKKIWSDNNHKVYQSGNNIEIQHISGRKFNAIEQDVFLNHHNIVRHNEDHPKSKPSVIKPPYEKPPVIKSPYEKPPVIKSPYSNNFNQQEYALQQHSYGNPTYSNNFNQQEYALQQQKAEQALVLQQKQQEYELQQHSYGNPTYSKNFNQQEYELQQHSYGNPTYSNNFNQQEYALQQQKAEQQRREAEAERIEQQRREAEAERIEQKRKKAEAEAYDRKKIEERDRQEAKCKEEQRKQQEEEQKQLKIDRYEEAFKQAFISKDFDKAYSTLESLKQIYNNKKYSNWEQGLGKFLDLYTQINDSINLAKDSHIKGEWHNVKKYIDAATRNSVELRTIDIFKKFVHSNYRNPLDDSEIREMYTNAVEQAQTISESSFHPSNPSYVSSHANIVKEFNVKIAEALIHCKILKRDKKCTNEDILIKFKNLRDDIAKDKLSNVFKNTDGFKKLESSIKRLEEVVNGDKDDRSSIISTFSKMFNNIERDENGEEAGTMDQAQLRQEVQQGFSNMHQYNELSQAPSSFIKSAQIKPPSKPIQTQFVYPVQKQQNHEKFSNNMHAQQKYFPSEVQSHVSEYHGNSFSGAHNDLHNNND